MSDIGVVFAIVSAGAAGYIVGRIVGWTKGYTEWRRRYGKGGGA